jgi:hypothetical protein
MRHSLFVYDDDDPPVGRIVPFLRSGLAAGEHVVALLERDKWQLVADALGSDADAISYLDSDAFYTSPEAALASFDDTIRGLVGEGVSAIRAFGQPYWGTEAEWNGWISYEAIVNRAFVDYPVWFVCGYDTREVPDAVLDGAFETHREVLTDGWTRNSDYREPEDVVRSRTPTPVPLEGLHALPVEGGAHGFRKHLRAELELAGVSDPDAENMLIAAGEVLANAQRHGGGQVSVEVGRIGDRFACEISDDEPGIDDPLAGFLPPRPGNGEDSWLWMARQRTRQLELVSSARGLCVRLWV